MATHCKIFLCFFFSKFPENFLFGESFCLATSKTQFGHISAKPVLYFTWMDLHEYTQMWILYTHLNLKTFYVTTQNIVIGVNFVKLLFYIFRFNPSTSTKRTSTLEIRGEEYAIRDKIQESKTPENWPFVHI